MSRQVFLLGVGIVLIGLGFALTNRILFQPGITEDNAGRIRTGMSRAQVEAILGGPGENDYPWICATNIKTLSSAADGKPLVMDSKPYDLTSGFTEGSSTYRGGILWRSFSRDSWRAPRITIVVGYDQNGTVDGLTVNDEDRSGSLNGFRSWLGW